MYNICLNLNNREAHQLAPSCTPLSDTHALITPIPPGGGALCARRLFNAIFLQVLVKEHGLKLSDF